LACSASSANFELKLAVNAPSKKFPAGPEPLSPPDAEHKLASVHGAPRVLRSDNGPEFVATAVLHWLADERIDTAHIDPRKPWQNGTDESFNGRFREECLDLEWFRTREEARVLIEAWRIHYNAVRPHCSLGW
jgi:putative transposase